MAGGEFPKAERLLDRADFERLGRSPNKAHSAHFLLIWEPSQSERIRVGITASRRVGPAVVRNRIKRLVREYYRQHKVNFPPGDYNFIAKRDAQSLTYADVTRELDGIMRRVLPGDGLKDTRSHN